MGATNGKKRGWKCHSSRDRRSSFRASVTWRGGLASSCARGRIRTPVPGPRRGDDRLPDGSGPWPARASSHPLPGGLTHAHSPSRAHGARGTRVRGRGESKAMAKRSRRPEEQTEMEPMTSEESTSTRAGGDAWGCRQGGRQSRHLDPHRASPGGPIHHRRQ